MTSGFQRTARSHDPITFDRRKEGPKPRHSVFVREHEGEHGCGRVAGSDVEFHCVLLSGDDDREKDLVGIAGGTDGEFGRRRNVVADAA